MSWFGNTNWKDDDPLGKRSEDFLYENATWAIYLRRDPRFACPKHYSDSSNAFYPIKDYYCPKCLGLGVKSTVTIIPIRINLNTAKLSLRQSDTRLEGGWTQYYVTTIDVPRNVKPQLEDSIITVEWDKPMQKVIEQPIGRPLRATAIWKIKAINDHIERELGWYDLGVEISNYSLEWCDALMPHFKKLNVLTKETWQSDSWW